MERYLWTVKYTAAVCTCSFRLWMIPFHFNGSNPDTGQTSNSGSFFPFSPQNQVRNRLTATKRNRYLNLSLPAVIFIHYFELTLFSILSSERCPQNALLPITGVVLFLALARRLSPRIIGSLAVMGWIISEHLRYLSKLAAPKPIAWSCFTCILFFLLFT